MCCREGPGAGAETVWWRQRPGRVWWAKESISEVAALLPVRAFPRGKPQGDRD